MLKNSILILLMLVLTTGVAIGEDSRIKRAQFTTSISDDEPENNITKLETSFKTLVFFTEIMNCNGCDITHQWLFNGEVKHEIKGTSKYDRYRWWSKLKVSSPTPGKWTVKVMIDGNVVFTKSLRYYIASGQKTIKKRLQIKSQDECEQKLAYFHLKTKENPDDPYFAFMFKKWGERCFEN